VSARKALGKGLGALIPGAEGGAAKGATRTNSVGIEQISPSRFQPRIAFEEELIEELAESIRSQGVIEPLIVRPAPDGTETPFELVAGERRWRAAQKAGVDSVPVIVREMSDREALEMALAENLQREDLNPVEEARAYRMLADEFGLRQEEVAARVGVDRSTVANALRLLKLEASIQDDIVWGNISAGHARALLQLGGAARRELHKKIIDSKLSVREAELLARKIIEKESEKPKNKAEGAEENRTASAIEDLEERLSRALGTKIVIRMGKRGGRLEIKFSNKDQLEGICNRIME